MGWGVVRMCLAHCGGQCRAGDSPRANSLQVGSKCLLNEWHSDQVIESLGSKVVLVSAFSAFG